jgi:DNA-binding transcriptional MerR regulator
VSKKSGLLSIGDISKFTSVSIKALRYYERIGILKPAYVDPDSLYRYYNFNQTNMVFLISLAVELDIPLKKLSTFIGEDGIIDSKPLFAYGKEVTVKKINALEKGLKFIELLEEKIGIQEQYPMHEIYKRELPQEYCYVLPYDKSFDTADPLQIAKLFNDMPEIESDSEYEVSNELLEYGFLSNYSGSKLERYAFVEVPDEIEFKERLTIPAGVFLCRQSDEGQIEKVFDIFKDHLDEKSSFIAIETEVFPGMFDISKPFLNELRVLVL